MQKVWEGPDKQPLSDRQVDLAEAYFEIAMETGKFDMSTGPNGAHYAPADKNPFVAEGLVCENCVFYNNDSCWIVEGAIEDNAVCKLWIIPEALLGVSPEPENESTDDMGKSLWGGILKPFKTS
jgi:hypothetical protein